MSWYTKPLNKIRSAPGAIQNNFSQVSGGIKGWGSAIKGSNLSKTDKAKAYGSLAKASLGSLTATNTGLASGIGGGIAGGAYGAMSDDTSVLGGMAKGATLGAGLGYGAKKAPTAYRSSLSKIKELQSRIPNP